MLKAEDIILINDEPYEKRIELKKKLKPLFITFLVLGIIGMASGIFLFTFAVINTYKDLDFNMIFFLLAPIVFFIFAIIFSLGLYYRTLYKGIDTKRDEEN